ncbi:hypothetical protein ACLOJK_041137 [Asimina triloba]
MDERELERCFQKPQKENDKEAIIIDGGGIREERDDEGNPDMGVITQTIPLLPHPNHPTKISSSAPPNSISSSSMSQSFHQGIFSFSDGFDRSVQQQQQQQHIAQQSRRDKMRMQGGGFEPGPATLVAIDDGGANELPVYESGGMLSEMFAFPPGAPSSSSASADLLDDQMASNYHRIPRPTPNNLSEWYAKQQQLGGADNRSGIAQHQISGMNPDSAAAMQLFLVNPPQARSPSPPPSSSTPLHMLLPNPSSPIQAFPGGGPVAFTRSPVPPSQFTWSAGENAAAVNSSSKIGGGISENQGLSLSLSSSLQQLEAAKAAEGLRMEDGVFYYDQGGGPSSSSASYPLKNLGNHPTHPQAHVSFGSLAVVNVLRNSKYRRAAQELLEEFCSVGRGQLKSSRHLKQRSNVNANPNPNGGGTAPSSASGAGGPESSSSSKDPLPLSPSDRFEHQRRKSRLLAMHEEA